MNILKRTKVRSRYYLFTDLSSTVSYLRDLLCLQKVLDYFKSEKYPSPYCKNSQSSAGSACDLPFPHS